MYKDLNNGRYPLMLVRNHVTLVTGFIVKKDWNGHVKEVTLKHYDPNFILSSNGELETRTYTFNVDGMETGNAPLIWNITPRPLTRLYCPFIKTDI